jgi:hypothetical protein
MTEKLKTELDEISNNHLEIITKTFIKERLEQTKKAYERECDFFVKALIKKSDEYGLVNDNKVENYIDELCKNSKDTFNSLLNQID